MMAAGTAPRPRVTRQITSCGRSATMKMATIAERQHLAHREHELPPIAHDLALPAGHGLHDVGVAAGDIAAERNAQDQADDDQRREVWHEGLRQREDDEHPHRGQKDDTTAEPVGQPSAEQRADDGATLRSGRGQTQERWRGMEGVADEDQHERDRIEIPGLDKDRGHHQPADPPPFRVIVADQIADGAIHRRLMRVRGHDSIPQICDASLRHNIVSDECQPRPGLLFSI